MSRMALVRSLLEIVEPLGIEFPDDMPDPVVIARGYVDGTRSEREYVEARDRWWAYIDRLGVTTQTRKAWLGRLALCLLATHQPTLDVADVMVFLDDVLAALGIRPRA